MTKYLAETFFVDFWHFVVCRHAKWSLKMRCLKRSLYSSFFVKEYEMKTRENGDAGRWGLWQHLASLQTAALQKHTKTPTWLFRRWRCLEKQRGNWSSQLHNILKITLTLPEWRKAPMASQSFYHWRRCLCTERNSALTNLAWNIDLRVLVS